MKKVVDLPEKHGRLGDLDELYNRIDGFVKQHSILLNDVQFIIDEILHGIKESDTLVESSKDIENDNIAIEEEDHATELQ